VAVGDLLAGEAQLEWRGTLLGSGPVARTLMLEGWQDLPDVVVSNAKLSGFHGSLPGQLTAGERAITWTFKLAQELTAFQSTVRTLRRLTVLAENPVEEPLALQLDGQKFVVMARVHRRAIPTDKQYALGYTQGAVQWVSTNPRQWLLPRKSSQAKLPTAPSGGLTFPLVFPLNFGQAVAGGEFPARLANAGSVDAWPVWRITGPVQGPTITNLDTGAVLRFDPTWSVPAGQTIEIDTRPGVRTVAFSPSGVSAAAQLRTRQWFPIPAGGDVRVGFTTSGSYQAAAALDALWYDENM
jgi:hypothetical protein